MRISQVADDSRGFGVIFTKMEDRTGYPVSERWIAAFYFWKWNVGFVLRERKTP